MEEKKQPWEKYRQSKTQKSKLYCYLYQRELLMWFLISLLTAPLGY